MPTVPATPPRVGMMATVRQRRALVTDVHDHAGHGGVLHLVRVEYTDSDGPPDDTLLWELEADARVISPRSLPRVEDTGPMPAADFDAIQRAARWLALSPYHGSAAPAAAPLAAPLFGAVQLDDFQLRPLATALQMPRVALMLADDVGLGKTIEAGLLLSELLMRRRLRRVLILCPAALRQQWRQELQTKFAIPFDLVDRDSTHQLRQRLGLDANPWLTFPRIIASYHYLKQEDVLADFRAVCQQAHRDAARLPWDLLIVDEVHNLAPAVTGHDSDLARMLREVCRWFEHRVFLSATPHNGYTRSFTGLLELLDPVRFTQQQELSARDRQRLGQVVIRRLKRDLNAYDRAQGRTPRFPDRKPEAKPVFFGPAERALAAAFDSFRKAARAQLLPQGRAAERAGSFAIEILNKRLLSCPSTFADSWHRFKEGLAPGEDEADLAEVVAAQRAAEADLDNDQEAECRRRQATRVAGAWFRRLQPLLQAPIQAVDAALARLGLVPDAAGQLPPPAADARLDCLLNLIGAHLRDSDRWMPDERLIVFTEYKTTLDYLAAALRAQPFMDDPARLRVLYGGLDETERESIKAAFNDPGDPVRLLLATDAASEGLNLQETARLVLHYDIPWNPARLDQRNGRLDRHGQARDVLVFHFTAESDADFLFLSRVMEKIEQVREDLGSMSELFESAFQRRFHEHHDQAAVLADLERGLAAPRRRTEVPIQDAARMAEDEAAAARHAAFARELDLSPETLRTTLTAALRADVPGDPLAGPDARGWYRLAQIPPAWRRLVDDALRTDAGAAQLGAKLALAFDPALFLQSCGARRVFRPPREAALLHLGHPLVRHALARLAHARYEGHERSQSRWTIRRGAVPPGADALLLLTVEEQAVNAWREPFHHWVQTTRWPVCAGRLGAPLPALPAAADRPGREDLRPDTIRRARDLWSAVEGDVKDWLTARGHALTADLRAELAAAGERERAAHTDLFRQRRAELDKALAQDVRALEAELAQLRDELDQPYLAASLTAQELRGQDAGAELARRREQHQHMRDLLQKEEQRLFANVLPARHTLRGAAMVFPVTVELRLPEVPA